MKLKPLFLTASGLLLSGANAQEMSTSLPLTSVGNQLMWSVGDQNLTLDVPVSGNVRLELYSPRIDPADYRSENFYGDERYDGGNGVANTTFSLVDADGKVVLSRVYEPGEASWETLFDQHLPAGQYRLQVQTDGNAKNSFAVRLAGVSASVSANRLSVTIHSQDWKPVLNVSTDGEPYVLKMYDGDGPEELQARLRDSSGRIYPMPVSADLAWTDLPLPLPAGDYTLELRQVPTAKQFSNTVSFALNRLGAEAPITLSRVDQTGMLRVSAELILPTGTVPTQLQTLVNNEPVMVDGQTERKVAQGNYTIRPEQVRGAEVTVDHSSVNVPKGGVGEAKIQIRPTVALHLEADKREVCMGDVVTFKAHAHTEFAGTLPIKLALEAAGLTLENEAALEGEFSAASPKELVVKARATKPGVYKVGAQLQPWNQSEALELKVRPDATALELTRAPLGEVKAGGDVLVRLTIKNTASEPVDYNLTDTLPAGLEATDATAWKGTLVAGETRELTYRARVLDSAVGQLKWNATLDTPSCSVPQQVTGQLGVTPPPAPAPETPAPAAVAPVESRTSVVTLPFDAPRESKRVILSHQIPAHANYVVGSAKLDGKTVDDPVIGKSGLVYWSLPAPTGNHTEKGAALRGVLSYELTHTGSLGTLEKPSLSVELAGARSELLQGKLDTQDFQAATSLAAKTVMPTLSENEGAVKLPLNGTEVRLRDRITVTVESALDDTSPLVVNGEQVSTDLIGTTVKDEKRGVKRLTYVGVPIVTGQNELVYAGSRIQVVKVGATERYEITPESLIADGSTPVRLKVRALDANGLPTSQTTVTVNTSLEPRTADANPQEAGYQLKLTDGEGWLVLQPQTSPTALKLSIQNGKETLDYNYEVRPDNNSVGVGHFSVTAGIAKEMSVAWQAKGYYEGAIGGGKLYVAADKDGLPTNKNTFTRYSVYGDASSETTPLQGIDPVAFTYDHPSFRAQYRRTSLPIDVLPVGGDFTALSAYSKSNPEVAGFVAMVPKDQVKEDLRLTEGRVIHLSKKNISMGSESLVLTTIEQGTGKVLSQKTLTANVDYTLDPEAGLIVLSRTLDVVDANFNEQRLNITYRVNDAKMNRQLAYGAQVKYKVGDFGVGAAAVSLDEVVTLGARVNYEKGNTRADGLLAYAGGIQASASVKHTFNEKAQAGLRARYQEPKYDQKGLGRSSDGLYVDGDATFKVTERLGLAFNGEYHDVPQASVANDALSALTQPTTRKGGSVTGRMTYDFKPFSVGLGAKYAFGDVSGMSAVGSVGYQGDRVSANVVHTQPINNIATQKATTEISAKYAFAPRMSIGFTDKVTWGIGHAAALALDSQIGNVNYAVGYELPTASGAGNRARMSVGTVVPLSRYVSAGLRGQGVYDFKTKSPEVGAGVDLSYKAERLSATLGTDVSYAKSGFGVTVRGGVTGSVNDNLTLSADGLYENRPATEAGKRITGQRLNLGYAYRSRNINSLGYARYLDGSLAATKPEVVAGATAEYRQATWAVRSGVDARKVLNDKDSLTIQAYGGATAYLNEWLGVGGWVRSLSQPGAKNVESVLGYGIEGNIRVLPGTWFTGGYNFAGFDNIPSTFTYTKPGAYVRLDMILDETMLNRVTSMKDQQ